MLRYFLTFILISIFCFARAQQDIDFHIETTFLSGKNILKIKRDFNDPYLWVLAQNNEVYRINSITKVIDNYTAKFSAYSGLQFIDIAGVGSDQVYVAANSANVVEYKSGTLKNIGAADGVVGVVNSIGIEYVDQYFSRFLPPAVGSREVGNSVAIGTNSGLCRFDFVKGIMLPGSSGLAGQVYETTYRNDLISDTETKGSLTPLISFAMTYLTNQTIYEGLIWYGNNSLFGEKINTVYATDGMVRKNIKTDNPPNGSLMNYYWGTEKGLFQNCFTRYPDDPYRQYLSGIPVNKVTSIYGMRSFNDYRAIKENLLVGTDQGLYYSNSFYGKFDINFRTYLNVFTLYNYGPLGTIKINDICVNATSYDTPICEDGIWVAAINGLYLLRPNYVPYINNTPPITAIQFDGANYGKSELQACGSVTASVQSSGYSGQHIQWYKDGQEMPDESNVILKIAQPGDYNAVLYDPCNDQVHFETNHLKVTSISAPVFTFNYPDQLNYCAGSTATLQTDNNPNYQYRWYKNGALNGNITNILNTIETGKYKLEVSACAGGWVSTKEVQLNFIKMPTPILTADKLAYCAGEQAKLSASVSIDASVITNWQPYQYRWFKDGVPIAGTTASISVSQPGKYKVEMTSCAGNAATSAEFLVSFITIVTPLVKTDKPAYCIGDAATLSANFVNDGTQVLNWLRNGVVMAANQNKASITTTLAGNYTVSLSSNITSCNQNSAITSLSFEPPPSISLERIITTTLCSGQSVDLKATYSGGTVKWSTGEAGDKISVKQSGKYIANVTTAAGCTVSKDIDLSFFDNPKLSMPDAALCQFTNDKITLTAPAGFVKYEWNGQAGSADFTTSTLGQITLTVTDNNGCTASQTINITSKCNDIHIPNTFTPNGDGTNDKWLISGLDGDASVNVKIYTRAGAAIFESQGYTLPWDGTYKGNKVAAGVYFYVIAAKGSKQVLSGSVTVLR